MPPNNTPTPPEQPDKLPNANAAWNASRVNRDVNVEQVMAAIATQINAAIDMGEFEANMTMQSIGLPPGPLPGRIRSQLVRQGYRVNMRGRDFLLVDWREAGVTEA